MKESTDLPDFQVISLSMVRDTAYKRVREIDQMNSN